MTEEAKRKISEAMKSLRKVSNPWKSGQTYVEPYYIYRKDIVRTAQIKESAEQGRNIPALSK